MKYLAATDAGAQAAFLSRYIVGTTYGPGAPQRASIVAAVQTDRPALRSPGCGCETGDSTSDGARNEPCEYDVRNHSQGQTMASDGRGRSRNTTSSGRFLQRHRELARPP